MERVRAEGRGRVSVVISDAVPLGEFPELAGVGHSGSVKSRAVVAGPDRQLWLWMHEMEAGASIRWERPPVGHLAYVWKGGVTVGAERLGPAGVLNTEHGGSSSIVAGPSGATVLDYHSRDARPEYSTKRGGHAHRVDANGLMQVKDNVYYDTETTVWADAACPTCDVWFHQSRFNTACPQGHAHFHPEDEIIFVVEGGMIVGRDVLKPGTALAVDANTVYGFGVAEGGLAFTNFRPTEPHFVMMSRDGPKHEPISERDHLRKGTTTYVRPAVGA